MKYLKFSIFFPVLPVIVIFFIISPLFPNVEAADSTKKILILPFNIHADKDWSFLKTGITDMLSTRIADDHVTIFGREETQQVLSLIQSDITRETAFSLARQTDADYVIFGSLTSIGSTVSTDGWLLDTRTLQAVTAFHETGQNEGDIITHVNRFAEKVKTELIGRPTAPDKRDRLDKQGKQDEQTINDVRQHPEKLWKPKTLPEPESHTAETPVEAIETSKKEPETAPPVKADADIPAPQENAEPETALPADTLDLMPDATMRLLPGAVWKSRNFPMEIIGISVADTDGDGSRETVICDENEVHIWRFAEGRFAKIVEVKTGRSAKIIGIDAADINGNGKAEIFITSINRDQGMLKSSVLEWDGSGFFEIPDNPRWYYRLIRQTGEPPMLIGQSRGVSDIFSGGVNILKWTGSGYDTSGYVMLPGWVNVFGFTMGDILNNRKKHIIAFTRNDHLRILDMTGEEIWRNNEPAGGTRRYLDFVTASSGRMGNVRESERQYLPQRLHIYDADSDGKNELIVVKNEDTAGRTLAKTRFFKSGHIACLVWKDLGFIEKWRTMEINGHISDYIIGDFDNDGKDELIFSVVTKIDSILGKPNSYLAAQKFK